MRRMILAASALLAGVLVGLVGPRRPVASAPTYRLVGWNDLGMHCLDADFSVFSILPPYNNVWAQLVDPSGNLVTGPGNVAVGYQAVADPAGSVNTTSVGKTNFWTHVGALFGASPAPDMGLAGSAMPGAGNVAQAMTFDRAKTAWVASGIPITPCDDAGRKNPYPMLRLVARDGGGAVLATTDVVVPVSDEMDCRACHASNAVAAAQPAAGWVNDPDPQRDYRLNVLRLHDDRGKGDPVFAMALAAAGYDPGGLFDTVTKAGTPILCARCHGSNALGTTGYTGVAPLTQAVHGGHAPVTDPANGLTLEASTNRGACYRCHPGSTTRCLRGAMGNSVAADGSLAIQCQSCHGSMSDVGSVARQGWLDEPSCQSCHTGDAVRNNGALRYTSVFDTTGQPRQAVSDRFATNADTPATGLSLYRLSTGHGGLYCEACHGSTHAEYPALHGNDNVQAQQIQGHAGIIAECATCHDRPPDTLTGGPHGMHPVGQSWVGDHKDAAEDNSAPCRACHGQDDRGTVLSRALGPRTVDAFGVKTFWQGFQIGCYSCHNGPRDEERNRNRPPTVQDAAVQTPLNTAVAVDLQTSDADTDPLSLRIVTQPAHGTVALADRRATFYPELGFVGVDHFTFAAWDGSTNSNLGTVTVTVMGPDTPTPGTPSPTVSPATTGTATPPSPTPTVTATARQTASATPDDTAEPGERRVYLPFAERRR